MNPCAGVQITFVDSTTTGSIPELLPERDQSQASLTAHVPQADQRPVLWLATPEAIRLLSSSHVITLEYA